jgi:hypothetical protein
MKKTSLTFQIMRSSTQNHTGLQWKRQTIPQILWSNFVIIISKSHKEFIEKDKLDFWDHQTLNSHIRILMKKTSWTPRQKCSFHHILRYLAFLCYLIWHTPLHILRYPMYMHSFICIPLQKVTTQSWMWLKMPQTLNHSTKYGMLHSWMKQLEEYLLCSKYTMGDMSAHTQQQDDCYKYTIDHILDKHSRMLKFF